MDRVSKFGQKDRLTIGELIAKYPVSHETVRRWMIKGYQNKKLPHSKVGRQYFVTPSAWSKFIRDIGGHLAVEQ